MVAIVVLCGTKIRYTHLLVHLGDDNLVGGVKKGGESSGCCSHGLVDLIQSMCVTSLVWENLDQFKGSLAMAWALGRWSLGAYAQWLSSYHQQHWAGFGRGSAAAALQRLALPAVVVAMWFKDIYVFFILFGGALYFFWSFYNELGLFLQNNAPAAGGSGDHKPLLGNVIMFLKSEIDQSAQTLWWPLRCCAGQE
jgi:hypothetical protein